MSDIRFNRWLHNSGTGGVTQDSSGNIGIGSSVPRTALDVVGIVSATSFSGAVTGNATGLSGTPNITVGSIIASSATISGNVSVAGTLTYEDVTNVDSIGIVTARTGVRIDAGGLVVVGVTTVAAGSTAAPSITPTGDSNTGIFFPAADTIAFGEGGSEAARIDSSGRFGLGTTTPGRKLVVAGDLNTVVAVEGSTSGTSNLFLGDTADEDVCALGYNHVTNSLGITVNASASPAVTIDSSGRLLVGTTSVSHGLSGSIVNRTAGTSSPGTYFRGGTWSHFAIGGEPAYVLSSNINASGNVTASETARGGIGYEYVNSSEPTRLVIGTVVASSVPCPVTFWSEGTERMRITSGGEIQAQQIYSNTTALAANVFVGATGQLNRSTSSGKYKTNVETVEFNYSENLLACRPVWYKSLCKLDNPDWGYWGFIAEEIAEIDPRLVFWKTTEPVRQEDGSIEHVPCDPEPEGVAYDRFVPHLLNLIKRQGEAIADLQAEVAALKA